MGGSEVSTQLELAAIFAAFVAITTLFSFVSLGAGSLNGESSPGTGAYPVLTAGEPHLAMVGRVTGSSSVPELSGISIDTLAFAVANTGEDGAVDLSRTSVTVMAGDYLEVLRLSGDTTPGPDTWTAALLRDGDGNGDGGTLLPAGEEYTVHLRLDRPVPAGEALTVKVRLEGDLPCSITGPVGVPGAGTAASSAPED